MSIAKPLETITTTIRNITAKWLPLPILLFRHSNRDSRETYHCIVLLIDSLVHGLNIRVEN